MLAELITNGARARDLDYGYSDEEAEEGEEDVEGAEAPAGGEAADAGPAPFLPLPDIPMDEVYEFDGSFETELGVANGCDSCYRLVAWKDGRQCAGMGECVVSEQGSGPGGRGLYWCAYCDHGSEGFAAKGAGWKFCHECVLTMGPAARKRLLEPLTEEMPYQLELHPQHYGGREPWTKWRPPWGGKKSKRG